MFLFEHPVTGLATAVEGIYHKFQKKQVQTAEMSDLVRGHMCPKDYGKRVLNDIKA